MTETAVEPDMLSLDPANVWARCPFSAAAIDRILAAPRLALRIAPDDIEAFRVTFAHLTDHSVLHLVLQTKDATRAAFEPYINSLMSLLIERAKVKGYRNGPPAPPKEWIEASVDWVRRTGDTAPTTGRAAESGRDAAFATMLSAYQFAFARSPSAAPGGPTFRFLNTFLIELRAAIADPPVPAVTDSAILACIKRVRNGAAAGWSMPVDLLVARFREALATLAARPH